MKSTRSPETLVILVGVDIGQIGFSDSIEEAALLVKTAGAVVAQTFSCKRNVPDPATFLGSGKVLEIAAAVTAHNAQLVVVNNPLSPGQQRNLEKQLQARVVDRTTLILDIFALRARSFEGKLQVELAQLQHLATRLVRGWTHLERQKGGIGLRGPGETQLETDRRLLGERVKTLKARLAKVQQQHDTRRKARMRNDVFNVSLVGYTNAGKSSLFNALTKTNTYTADALFATLDTTTRRIYLPEVGHIVLSDTVGFIRDLPHELVAAFRSTLEESIHADLLLQVVDISHPMRDEHIDAVNKVLREIGAPLDRQVLVFNKVDLLPDALLSSFPQSSSPSPNSELTQTTAPDEIEGAETSTAYLTPAWLKEVGGESVIISARTGLGIKQLLQMIAEIKDKLNIEAASLDSIEGTSLSL